MESSRLRSRLHLAVLMAGLLVAPASIAARQTAQSSVATVLDRYERGDWSGANVPTLADSQLRSMLGDLKKVTPVWIKAASANDIPRRRLAAASFVLELLSSQNDPLLWDDGKPASDMLEWACGLLREAPPTPAERTWYLASFALLERLHAIVTIDRHIEHATARSPSEERWALIRGISQDLRTWPEPRDEQAFSVTPAVTTNMGAYASSRISLGPSVTPTLLARYAEAAAKPAVRQEALLRLGYFEFRRGNVDAALARFGEAGTPDDPALRYWLHLFTGRALEQAHRLTEAVAAYHSATIDVPNAQSATFAYAAALVANHQAPEAASFVLSALASQPAPPDPWMIYAIPDMRFWPALMAELRKAITP